MIDLLPETDEGEQRWDRLFSSMAMSRDELYTKLSTIFCDERPSRIVARIIADEGALRLLSVSLIDRLGVTGHWLLQLAEDQPDTLRAEIEAMELFGRRVYPSMEIRALANCTAVAFRAGPEHLFSTMAHFLSVADSSSGCAKIVRTTYSLLNNLHGPHECDLRSFHDVNSFTPQQRNSLRAAGLSELTDGWDSVVAAWPVTFGQVTTMCHGGLTPDRVMLESTSAVMVFGFSNARVSHWATDFVSLELALRVMLYQSSPADLVKLVGPSFTDLGRTTECTYSSRVGASIVEVRRSALAHFGTVVEKNSHGFEYPTFEEEYLVALLFHSMSWLASTQFADGDAIALVAADCRTILQAVLREAAPALLFGMISCVENGVDRVLVRVADGQWDFSTLGMVPEGVNEQVYAEQLVTTLFGSSETVWADFVASTFSAPEIRCLVDAAPITALSRGVSRSCTPTFFRLEIGRRVDLRNKEYSWVRKSWLLSGSSGLTPRNPELVNLLRSDWVTPMYGRRVLKCVDVIVFRERGTEVEFLLLRRENESERQTGWEYPKGGLELHETPLEAAERELLEETGVKSVGYFIHGGELGRQTADVSWRDRDDYDTLNVTGVTYLYVGPDHEILPAVSEGLTDASWVSLPEAESMLWIGDYGVHFLRLWDESKSSILHSIARPRSVVFQLTETCNVQCRFCHRRLDAEPSLDLDEIRRVVRSLALRGVQRLTLTGGEPLLLGKSLIFDVVRYAHDQGLSTSLSTTGIGLSRGDFVRLGASLDHILLSLHTVQEDCYELLYRNEAMAARVLESVANAIHWASGSGIIVEVCTVATARNLDQVVDVGRWITEQGQGVLWRIDQYYANGPQTADDETAFHITDDQFESVRRAVSTAFPNLDRIRFNGASSRAVAPDFMITPQGNLVTSASSEYTVVGDSASLMSAEFKNRVPWEAYLRYCRDWD